MRVIVVGAGIGGLSLTIGLRRAGHDVVVLEQTPRIDAVGAGITLFGNATAALGRLGVRAGVEERGAAARSSAILDASGRTLATLPPDLLDGAVAIHRADLQAVLAEAAGPVQLGVTVTGVEQAGDAVVVRGAGGLEQTADVVVGADGLRSAVRRAVNDAVPRPAGYVAWRGVVALEVRRGGLTETWGVGERFGLVDIGHGRTYWFATKNTDPGQGDDRDGRRAELVRRFAAWHDPIAEVLAATDEPAILRNDVFDLPSGVPWRAGRIVLLGDAAHAATPGVGQGAAQAIEDAVVLAAQLDTAGDVESALLAYETIRRPRAEHVQQASRRMDRMAQLGNGLGARVRDTLVRHAPARTRRRQIEPLVRPVV